MNDLEYGVFNRIPLCVACSHFMPSPNPDLPPTQQYAWARCALAKTWSPVTGEGDMSYCSTERTSGTCGPHGTRFTAKVEAA